MSSIEVTGLIDRIFGLAMVALGLFIWYLANRADDEVEASVTRALGPVVPLEDLMHEQDSAEAYDDLPDMDAADDDGYSPCPCSIDSGHGYGSSTEAEDINGDGSLVIGPGCMDEIRARKEWAEHWNARLALDFDGGAR